MWWLSFCDGDRPAGEQFLGATIVPGESMTEAVVNAHIIGCNPGGAVQGVEVPEHMEAYCKMWIGRLLTKDDCAAFDKNAPGGK